MAAPVGSTGCEGESDERSWQLGVNYAYVVSRLSFDGQLDALLTQHAAMATVGYRVLEQTSIQLNLGGVLAGDLRAGADYSITPGPLLSGQISRQWLDPGRAFLVTSLSFGFSAARAKDEADQSGAFWATDARLSAVFGYRLGEHFSPFLFARAFGGPISWEAGSETLSGSDRNHYALGAGLIVRASGGRLSFAGSALGERSISLGLSWEF